MNLTNIKKIKVGFGPETTANSFYQSGVKVARELNKDEEFTCSTFKEPFECESLKSFDVLIFIKICPSYDILKRLKDDGKVLILDYQDMFLYPSIYERNPIKKILKKMYYFSLEREERKRYALFNGCFIAAPLLERVVAEAGMKPIYLFRQIYNDWNCDHRKKHCDKTKKLTILWTGSSINLSQNKQVEPILKCICEKHDCRVVYLTQSSGNNNGFIKYKNWSIDTWEKDLLEADIAFRWWENSNDQYHKDSNKIISYMAAGVPVVCRPTYSDKFVIEDGKTGFFAESPEEFGEIVESLILDVNLRKNIGEEAFKEVWANYNLNKHVKEIRDSILKMTGFIHRTVILNKKNGNFRGKDGE